MSYILQEDILPLRYALTGLDIHDSLRLLHELYGCHIAFINRLSDADLVMANLIDESGVRVRSFLAVHWPADNKTDHFSTPSPVSIVIVSDFGAAGAHELIEWDEQHGAMMYRPLLHWSVQDVATHLSKSYAVANAGRAAVTGQQQ